MMWMPNSEGLGLLPWMVATAFLLYFITTALAWESGLFDIFERIRGLAPAGSRLDYLLSCPVCLSPYFLALLAGYAIWQGAFWLEALLVCGVIAGIHWFLVRMTVFGRNK